MNAALRLLIEGAILVAQVVLDRSGDEPAERALMRFLAARAALPLDETSNAA